MIIEPIDLPPVEAPETLTPEENGGEISPPSLLGAQAPATMPSPN